MNTNPSGSSNLSGCGRVSSSRSYGARAAIAPLVSPDSTLIDVLAPLAGGVLIALWWLLFSRARWTERIGCSRF